MKTAFDASNNTHSLIMQSISSMIFHLIGNIPEIHFKTRSVLISTPVDAITQRYLQPFRPNHDEITDDGGDSSEDDSTKPLNVKIYQISSRKKSRKQQTGLRRVESHFTFIFIALHQPA